MTDLTKQLARDHPIQVGWRAYKKTEEFTKARTWALRLTPIFTPGTESEERAVYEIMTLEQREKHVMLALWHSFVAGYLAGAGGAGASNDPTREGTLISG